MIEDLKTDELNLCESVEPECQPEDSRPAGPRARQKQENRNGTDGRTDEEFGLAGDPLAVSPDGTPESSHEEVDENRQRQVVEPDVVKSTDACREGMMATEKQLAANRANAKHSTGPKSKAGKTRSSMNSRKHGFAAEAIMMAGEDPAEFAVLHRSLI